MWATPTSDQDTEFLRRRVRQFGGSAFAFIFAFWLFRIGFGHDPRLPHMLSHLGASLALLGVWLAVRRPGRTARFIRTAEATGVLLGCALFVYMGTAIPPGIVRPDLIMLLALTIMTNGRAAYVPSSGRRTAVLGALVGCALLLGVHTNAAGIDIDAYAAVHSSYRGLTSSDYAAKVTIMAAAWWTMATGLAVTTSQIIYGLRREARRVKRLGQYRLGRKLGEGGMGVVYEAQHAMLRRPAAIKLLRADNSGEQAIRRFEREVKLTARLRHPNTITVYDYGRTPDGVFYYAMELLDGATLQQIVSKYGPMHPGRVKRVLTHMAGALAEAHDLGLIHRDIKPSNVMLCNQGGFFDVTKVLDFGLVKDLNPTAGAFDSTVEVGKVEAIAGTPSCMAPEAVTSPESVDAKSDLYSLGAVGYFMLAGQHVFDGKNAVEICGKHVHEAPIPPSQRGPSDVPPDLERLVLRCLSKRPEERPADSHQVLAALEACVTPDWGPTDTRRWWEGQGSRFGSAAYESVELSQTVVVDLGGRT